jgi:hypothetical protein
LFVVVVAVGRPLEQYGLMYEDPARRLLGLSRAAFRALVLPTAWVKNPLYSTAPHVGVYDPCTLVEIARALRQNRAEWLAQCRAFVSRRREQIDADVRVAHDDFMRRACDWNALRQERAEERRYWARAAGTRTENLRGDQPALGGSVEVAVVVDGRRYILDLTSDGDDANPASRAG